VADGLGYGAQELGQDRVEGGEAGVVRGVGVWLRQRAIGSDKLLLSEVTCSAGCGTTVPGRSKWLILLLYFEAS
jgi:hypothetical protein